MKRPLALLALPILLAALLLGVKWRVDHPTPTKEDLEIRMLMSQAVKMQFSFDVRVRSKGKTYSVEMNKKELKPFIDCFYVSSHPANTNQMTKMVNKALVIQCYFDKKRKDHISSLYARISLDKRERRVVVATVSRFTDYELHPVTVKRWLELLLDNPRIGPELRKRMK